MIWRRSREVRTLSWLLLMAGSLLAQVPPRATVLNPSGGFYGPTMTRVGDTVHACGIAGGALQPGFIHYARSRDGGRTWPLREFPLGFTNECEGIAADGDLVVVLVNSHFFGPHTITSTDGGSTWALPVRVSQQSGHDLWGGTKLHVRGTTVSVCWYEDRPGGLVWFNQSTDGGFTWRPVDQALNNGVPASGAAAPTYVMLLSAAGSVMNVIWAHWTTSGITTVNQRSLDGGVSWQPAQVVTNGTLEGVAGEGSLLVVCEYNSPNVWRSTDGGATWGLVANHGLQDPWFVSIDGQVVMLLGYVAVTPQSTIEATVSLDGGATWSPRSTLQIQGLASARPHVGGGGLFLQVHHIGNLFPPSGVVYESINGGLNWRPLAGEAGNEVWPFADSCLVTTRTTGTGSQMHAYVLTGHTTLGSGTVGTGGAVPSLEASGQPSLGRTFRLELAGARGGSHGCLGVAFAPPVSVPLGVATLHLQSPIVPFVFTTSGTSGAAGVGGFTLAVVVPNAPVFAGLPFVSQAFVHDPNAVDGFTATHAIETWIE